MITASNLTKRYGGIVAVDDVSSDVQPGTLVRRASIADILIALVVIGGSIIGTAMPSAAQRYLPFNALQATVTVRRGDDLLPPLTALWMLLTYVVLVVAASVAIERRDV
jgi:hypothetical protein